MHANIITDQVQYIIRGMNMSRDVANHILLLDYVLEQGIAVNDVECESIM
jgi:hypothetical protein